MRFEPLMLLTVYWIVGGFTNAPFPKGYFMSNQGTILQDNWISSREPWIPAIVRNDESRFGFSAGAISLYDRMDNLENRSIYSLYGGGWFQRQPMRFNGAYSQFEAFGIYYKQDLYISAGFHFWKQLRMALNFTGSRIGLYDHLHSFRTGACAGLSMLYKFRVVSIAATIDHLTLKHFGGTATDPLVQLVMGIHTHYNRIGAQGVVISVTPDAQNPVRFILGEEFRFSERIGINASISNNPVFVGIGFFADIRSSDITVGLTSHTDLGWSRGCSVSYSR